MDKALKSIGDILAKRTQAHKAIIGLPDDGSWNDPGRYIQTDEDEPGLHPSLTAQTRVGDPSVVAIPILEDDAFDASEKPNNGKAKEWFLRNISISRKTSSGS